MWESAKLWNDPYKFIIEFPKKSCQFLEWALWRIYKDISKQNKLINLRNRGNERNSDKWRVISFKAYTRITVYNQEQTRNTNQSR